MYKNPLVAIDLFAGCGGLSMGLKQAGIKINAAVEIETKAKKTYEQNHGNIVVEEDIRNIDGKELLDKAGIKEKDLFLLAGCPPCQGFSKQRKPKEGIKDDRNDLIFQFIRLIDETKPAFILMENVPGMVNGVGKKIFTEAMKKVKENYYIVFDILNAADYGVPQSRKRLVLHGIRKDLNKIIENNEKSYFGLPNSTHSKKASRLLKKWNTVKVIKDLPSIKAGDEYKGDKILNHKCLNLHDINIKRIKYIRKHGGSRDCLPESLQLNCHKGYNGHKDVYGIMDWNKPSPTITGGCLCFSKGRFGHPDQDRALSVREAARLQTFPDDYVFYGNMGDMALQIGNAIPVKLAEASGKVFKKCYEKILLKINEIN